MWELVAPFAAELPVDQSGGQLPILIFGLLGTVFVVLGTVMVALINSRTNRTTASPPSPFLIPNIGERVAVLEHRAEDCDDRDELQDRRLNRIEQQLDIGRDGWP